MNRKAVIGFAVFAMVFGAMSCKEKEEAPVTTAEPPPAPVPVAEPVETEAPDTETATATEPELPPVEEPAAEKTAGIAKGSLIGNYKCSIDGDFPITPPPATCKIYEGSDGSLKIGPVGGTGINGSVKINGNRLIIAGAFNLGVGNLKVNASLNKRNAKTFKGKGTGEFAGASIKYTLTLNKM